MLSYIRVEAKIAIPAAIAISLLILGLTKYYSRTYVDIQTAGHTVATLRKDEQSGITATISKNVNIHPSTVLFIAIFAVLILISSFTYTHDFHTFTNWSNVGITSIIQLGAAIMLCFFIPGYGIILIITKKYEMHPILRVLLAYILSMLVTGLTGYISALSFDNAISESKIQFIILYIIIFAAVLICYRPYATTMPIHLQVKYYFNYNYLSATIIRLWKNIKTRSSELLVFGSLFLLIITSTYLLYGGITIGDQWYHQGRALLFMSGSFREAVISNAEGDYYPPLQSALLAVLTNLSGMPLVNAYASIAFLNAIPMFAFYYFFLRWTPPNLRKAGLLASSLFTLSSGFGWIYFLMNESRQIITPLTSLETLRSIGQLDIVSISNFVVPTAPDFSTGLIYIALPAGFVLLAIIKTRFPSNFINIFLVSAISVLGIVSHYEFYIFIIIASILPFIFKMKGRNYVYASFLIALSIVYMMDMLTPGNFNTSLEIRGLPLLLIAGMFVIISWTIYFMLDYLVKIARPRVNLLGTLKKLSFQNTRINFTAITLIYFFVAYLYLLSFVVLTQLPLDTIRDHTSQSNVPWYLYPMRLGAVGILGLAFILSYVFKRFEKEVLVFGVMIVIALITGPYYSESRFSKYVMVGMIGFASIMFYYIVSKFGNNPVRNVALVGTIIVCSGLSTLMFIGYGSLILQTEDYVNTLPRRHFPSSSELHLFELLHNQVDIDSKKYNVVSFPNEYNRWQDGLMAKIPAFAGLPYDKVRESPLSLNASSLENLFRNLYHSETRFIILPKNDIDVGSMIPKPTQFAIEHFKRFYEDKNYLVLEVPALAPPTPSPEAKVGLVYDQRDNARPSELPGSRLLNYDSKTFNFKKDNGILLVQKDNLTQGIIVNNSKKDDGITIWSKTINDESKPNYIETKFRINSENENKSDDIRLRWKDGEKEYFTKLSEKGLELFEKSDDGKSLILSRNLEITKESGMWYTVKIESLHNSINVYVNDILKIHAPKTPESKNTQGISRIGLSAYHSNVEFGSIKIWGPSYVTEENYDKIKYYNYYYPLSLLALSKVKYDIFRQDDLSAFSKDIIFVDDSSMLDNSTLSKYLDYVHEGGTLIVINSDSNFNGNFSRLFSISTHEVVPYPFDKIEENSYQNNFINVSGFVKRLDIESSPGLKVISSYRNNKDEIVAPFAVEKIFSDGGKIILVNAEGYFNTISNSPSKYFSSLSNISKLLPIDASQITYSQTTSPPIGAFVGNMGISGRVTFNSTSLSLVDEKIYPYILKTSTLTVHNRSNDTPITYANLLLKGISIFGQSNVNINVSGPLNLPNMFSDNDFMGVSLPNEFNMSIHLGPKTQGQLEIIADNNPIVKSIRVESDSEIDLYNVGASPPIKFVPVLLKNPEITVNGNISIKNTYFNEYLDNRGALLNGDAFDLNGTLKMKIDFIDHYDKPYRGGTSRQYINYLHSLWTNGTIVQDDARINLPGDISVKAIEQGKGINLIKILSSSSHIITLIVLIAVTAIMYWLVQKYRYKFS